MHFGRQTLTAVGFLGLGILPATAATTTVETYNFEATLSSGHVYCGVAVGLDESCSDKFGTYSGSAIDDLMLGKSMGGIYSGQIVLGSEAGKVTSVTCSLGGADCFFGDDLLAEAPFGPNGRLNFAVSSVVNSVFEFSGDTGSYFFATDYMENPDGIHYYAGVRFDLSDVSYEISAVPLSGSVGFLAFALGGIAAFSRRKSRRRQN